jgi:hypothetical protein
MESETKTFLNPTEKANAFNKAFLSFSNLDTSNASLPEVLLKTDANLSFIHITEKEVLDI